MYSDKLVEFQPHDTAKLKLFPNTRAQMHAVRLWITTQSGETVRCDVIFHAGRIVNLEFNRPPRVALEKPFTLKSLEIYADLMTPDLPRNLGEAPTTTPILDALRSHGTITDVKPPAQESEIDQMLGRILTATPSDYAALLRETNGFQYEWWDFHGIDILRQVDHEATYLYLAQTTSFSLALREEASTPCYFLQDHVNEEFTELGSTFVDALLKAVAAEEAEAE
ncbi:MAG: hypothetical protein ABIY70_02110 [Capsulimonas sp.]|uniref:hypothetical protein n=1 Tax=Capsulimonas sp. TaxID=2494211 RepID=UPI0032663EF7